MNASGPDKNSVKIDYKNRQILVQGIKSYEYPLDLICYDLSSAEMWMKKRRWVKVPGT